MSDQFNRFNKRQGVVGKIIKLKDQLEDYKCEIDELQTECERLEQELDAAIQRAQEFEEETIRLRDELGHIANAKPIDYQSFTEFAQSRARHALGQEAGTLTIKK